MAFRALSERSFVITCVGLVASALLADRLCGQARGSLVQGVVLDSLVMRPLAGAVVQLAGDGESPRTVTTAEDGRFEFADLAAGRYLLAFAHPILDSLGLEAGARPIEVAESSTARVPLAIPSPRSIVRLLCPEGKNQGGTGALLGFVRSAEDGFPMGQSTVWVRFDDYVVSRRRVQRDSMGREVRTKENGYFAICGIPAGVTVLARAASGVDTSGFVELELQPNAFLKRDLYIGKVFRVAAPPDTTTPAPPGRAASPVRQVRQVMRGSGVISGAVRQTDGRPISGARLSVWGTGREVQSSETGAFALDSLPTGSHMVDVRALGFLPERRAVDVRDGVPTNAVFGMTAKQLFLDTVRVLATRAYVTGRLAEFEGRRRSRVGGYFLDQDEIDRRRAASFTDLMRGIPTVAIDPDSRHGDQVRMIGASNENDPYCDPSIWIDGMKQPQRESSLNAVLFPERIVALEVYSRTVEAPVQFQSGSRCGVILVWTGERVRRQVAPEKR